MKLHTQYLAYFEDKENGVCSYVTMGKRGYSVVLYDLDAEDAVSVKMYDLNKFDFEFVKNQAFIMLV
mgnify:CR=1 FL=1